jgi:hypothetical protein
MIVDGSPNDRTGNRRRGGRVRGIALSCFLALCLGLAWHAEVAGSTNAATPASRLRWIGRDWFLEGANLPWLHSGCDFGCLNHGGVLSSEGNLAARFRTLSRHGVRVVRWYLFPGDAWQIARGADGAPASLQGTRVFPDMDAAVALAEHYDIYLDFVLFSDTRTIPATWMSDPVQRAQLASALTPLFRRYAGNPHVLSYELFDEPERGIDAGLVTQADVQATVQGLAAAIHLHSHALASIGPESVESIGLWTGLGLDFYAPHWFSGMASPACALCTNVSQLAAAYGADRPVVIGAMDPGGSAVTARMRLASARARGYAGALLWSALGATHPTAPSGSARVPQTATWRFAYANPDAGPHMRPLNPCIGPQAWRYLCPELRMSSPSGLSARTDYGRVLLLSRNSINSMGTGPAELFGRPSGEYTMSAVQNVHLRHGGYVSIATGATLFFKPVPGQYRYWKWKNAAAMQLWRLDSSGHPIQLARVGPKTTYCLRDLKRTHGHLPGSPIGAHYPGCSQDPHARSRTVGTSVGWSDIYPATYNENYIDVTGLRGCFAYVHIADPNNVIYESNDDNNASAVTVRLPWTGSSAGCSSARRLPVASADGGGY